MTDEHFSLRIQSLVDFDDNELAEKFLRTLLKQGNVFLPDRYDTHIPAKHKFNETTLLQAVDIWLNEESNNRKLKLSKPFKSGSILLLKGKKEDVSYSINWFKQQEPRFNSVVFGVYAKLIVNPTEDMAQFYALCEELIVLFTATKARIVNSSYPEGKQTIDLNVIHPEIGYKEYFGQPYIEMFGKEKLLSTPCYRTEEVAQNIISLQLSPDIFTPVSDDVREAVKQHLGVKAFVETGMNNRDYINGDKETLVPKFDYSKVTLKI